MDGLFLEIGPLRIQQNLSLEINPYSWTNNASVVFVDQPAGTGLSYTNGSYTLNQTAVNIQFYAFLEGFFALYPNYTQHDIYLCGESYFGHYSLALATYILNQNNATGNTLQLNLKGLAIGNGWIDPPIQYSIYAEYSYGIGIVGHYQRTSLEQSFAQCNSQLAGANWQDNTCDDVTQNIIDASGVNNYTINVYDYRLYDKTSGNDWPEGIHLEAAYLNRPEVRAAIHIPSYVHNWHECSMEVNMALNNDSYLSFKHLLPPLLDGAGLRILLYSGSFDWICNRVGTEELVRTMDWSGTAAFNTSQRYTWAVNEKFAGYGITVQNLTFLIVFNGSHMVPMNCPEQTLDMITRFFANASFADMEESMIPAAQPGPGAPKTPLSVLEWSLIAVSCFVAGATISAVIAVLVVQFYVKRTVAAQNAGGSKKGGKYENLK